MRLWLKITTAGIEGRLGIPALKSFPETNRPPRRPPQELAHVCPRNGRSGIPSQHSRRTRDGEQFKSNRQFKRIQLQKGNRNLRREGAGGVRLSSQNGRRAKLQTAFGRPSPDRRVSSRRRHLWTGKRKRASVYGGGDREHHGSPDQTAEPRTGGGERCHGLAKPAEHDHGQSAA